jgi:hypothetical protein
MRISKHSSNGYAKGATCLLSISAASLVGFYLWHYSFDWPLAEDFEYFYWHQAFSVEHTIGAADILLFRNGSTHPVGVQAALGLLTMRIFGLTLTPLLALNFVFILAAGSIAAIYAGRGLTSKGARILVWPLLILVFFHPTQANHLLWPFELGWMVISFLLVANAALIERYRTPLAAVPGAIVALFCSAHGELLVLTAAFHALLLPDLRRRWSYVAGFLAAFALVLVLWADTKVTPPSPGALAIYYVSLLGSLSGCHDHALLFVLGALAIVLVGVLSTTAYKQGLDAPNRFALVLLCYGLMASSIFSLGRSKYGLDWVLDRFHAAPLLMPIAAGLTILGVRQVGDRTFARWRWAGALTALVLVLASIPATLPYAVERGRESRDQRAVAMTLTCAGKLTGYMFRIVNVTFLDEIIPKLVVPLELCGQPIPASVEQMLQIPQTYRSLILRNEAAREPLERLWLVYLYRFDLQRALPPEDPATPSRLLVFAQNDARTGSHYQPEALQDFAQYYSTVDIPNP